MTRPLAICAALFAFSSVAGAQTLELPQNATRAAEEIEQLASYRLPIGPYEQDRVETIWAEGALTRQAWQIQSEGVTTLQLLAPLRDQLVDQGYDILFECEADSCGGFEFRFATQVMPEPQMHVDLGDYRFLSAQRMGETSPEYISLMISRTALRGFVQVSHIGPDLLVEPTTVVASTKSPDPQIGSEIMLGAPLNEQLQLAGRAILQDLYFETGSAQLSDGSYQSLAELADYLSANPDATIALVGHTDAEGGLDGNIALSRKRAQSVMQRLVETHGVLAAQIEAQGVGFLAPVASNQTDTGRTQNRRVEVIITSTH